MSLNKGKAKAKPAKKPAKKTTAATAGIPKRAVMNRRKYNEAISGDTMSNYAMYKKGGKIKKYQTAGQAYMKYVPGAQPSDTLGVNDPDSFFGYPNKTTVARRKMLDLTYGPNRQARQDYDEGSGEAVYNRISQSKKDVEDFNRELKDRAATGNWFKKQGGKVKKYKSGGSKFPDLTGDGKLTKADILKGRGVFKKGGSAKKKK